MTTVDELFAAMSAPKADRVILTIDEDLRIIDIPNLAVVIGAEGDKDVNRLYFKMDRLYRGDGPGGVYAPHQLHQCHRKALLLRCK